MNQNQISNLLKNKCQNDQNLAIQDASKKNYEILKEVFKHTLQGESQQKVEFEFTHDSATDIMTESQLFQFRQQILAYKYLIRNAQIPRNIDENLLTLSSDQWKTQKQKLVQQSLQFYNDKVQKNEDLRKLLQEKIMKRDLQLRMSQNEQIPEQTLKYFVSKSSHFLEKRKNELSGFIQSGLVSNENLVKLQCELKFLELKDFYAQTKQNVLGEMMKRMELEEQKKECPLFDKQLLDRKYYIKERPQKKQEAKMVEKFESQIRHEQDQRKRLKQIEFMNQLFTHQAEFFEYHRKKYKQSKKRAKNAKSALEQREKKMMDVEQKEEQKRIEILKDHQYEEYIELVKNTKNKRILQLLQETDKFLREIGARVRIQKGEIPSEELDEEMNDPDQMIANLKEINKIYYNITHQMKEEITTQPHLLENGQLKQYQVVGLQWLVSLYNNRLNGILADEMGLGKTIMTIALFCYLMEIANQVKKVFGPFLIVVPLTTLSNWLMEFSKWAPSLKVIAYKVIIIIYYYKNMDQGMPLIRKQLTFQLRTTKWNVCITTYEYIMKDRLVLSKFDWKYIIVDEGHRMKNSRSKFAQTLGQQYQAEYRLLLTGTPLQNNLSELWSLLNFLLPMVFNSCDDFEKWFSMPLNKMSNESEASLNEEEQLLIINRLHQVLRPFLLRRIKKEVAFYKKELPEKKELVIKVQLSLWQQIVYQQIKEKTFNSQDLQTGIMTSKSLQNLMMQLRKICNHPYLFINYQDYMYMQEHLISCSGKFEVLDRIIPKFLAFKHRILLFSQFTLLLDILEIFFSLRGWKYLRLDGGTKDEDRKYRLELFNEKNSIFDIFMLSTRAGGLGLNLQSADTVILFDSDWNPQMDLQASDRAHRIGQEREVRVIRLVTNTPMEEAILQKAAEKITLDQIFIQLGEYNTKSTEQERKERLSQFLSRKSIYDELDDEIPNDEQINEMIARSDEEIQVFDQMDNQRYNEEKQVYNNFKLPGHGDEKVNNYRLISRAELPPWLQQRPQEKEVDQQLGRGSRIRKKVRYNELSDAQWIKLIEEGKDPNEFHLEKQEMEVEYGQQSQSMSNQPNVGIEEHEQVSTYRTSEDGTQGGNTTGKKRLLREKDQLWDESNGKSHGRKSKKQLKRNDKIKNKLQFEEEEKKSQLNGTIDETPIEAQENLEKEMEKEMEKEIDKEIDKKIYKEEIEKEMRQEIQMEIKSKSNNSNKSNEQQ